MTIQLRFAVASDIGLIRKNNQDSGYASQTLFAVADGMGGAAAGDLASAVAIAHLAEIDGKHQPDELLPLLHNALNTAHAELALLTEENPQFSGMGTTCVAFLRSGNKLALAHIGDSRAYLLRAGQLTQVTHDHTLVQYLVDTGQITAEEAKTHPKRNVIMRALSDDLNEKDLAIDESIRETMPGDRWLLCSDGLYGPVSMELIHSTLTEVTDLNACAKALIGHALAGGAPDNVTVVLADTVESETSDIPAEFAEPRITGAAAIRKIQVRSAGEIAAQAVALTSSPDNGVSGKLGGSALVNAPDDQSLYYGNSLSEVNSSDTAGKLYLSRATSGEAETVFLKKRKHHGAKIAAFFGLLIFLAGSIFGFYTWTQSKYYIAPAGEYIGIYRGIPTEIGPIKLSRLAERSDLRISELSDFVQKRLETPITRDSFDAARETVRNLSVHKKADQNE